MSNLLKYKSYIASIRLEVEDEVLVGRVINTNDVISFESETAVGLVSEFHKAIDDYLAYCEEKAITPEKPFNGQFMIRADSGLHKELFELAAENDIPMNELAVSVLRNYVDGKKNKTA
jgi:predicted HicB family RNase H-like nuclease